MHTKEIVAASEAYVAPTYRRYPVAPVRGAGTRLWDAEGREYLDFIAGIAVCNLGHCHPEVVRALQEQAETLFHVSNLYYLEPQARLAQMLAAKSFAARSFFCNSGAEANEAAIKLARLYGRQVLGQAAPEIITMRRSFHGRTLATLSATGQEKIQTGYDPLLAGFRYVPYDDPPAVAAAVNERTCAVMVEPVQGEGGVIVPAPGYLEALRRLCDDRRLLLILDEVQTGMGRTGRLFAYQHTKITPDVMTLAKALGGGFPIGAMLATEPVAALFGPGTHASTFGGNPLACSTAARVLELIDTAAIMENCQRQGEFLRDGLQRLAGRHGCIREVRGLGLMVGVELETPVATVVDGCREKGILVGPAGTSTLRLTPPLIVTPAEIEILLSVLDEVLP